MYLLAITKCISHWMVIIHYISSNHTSVIRVAVHLRRASIALLPTHYVNMMNDDGTRLIWEGTGAGR